LYNTVLDFSNSKYQLAGILPADYNLTLSAISNFNIIQLYRKAGQPSQRPSYGLEGPGSNPGGEKILVSPPKRRNRLSGPTQTPLQYTRCSFPAQKPPAS